MHRSALPRKQKSKPFKRSSHAANQTTAVVFTRPTRRHNRRVGRSRKSRARTAGLPLASRSGQLGRPVGGRPPGKPIQLGTGIPALEQLSNPCGREALRHHRSGPFHHNDSHARRVLMHPKTKNKEKNTMTTAAAIHATEEIPNAVSLVQDIPLSRIQKSKPN